MKKRRFQQKRKKSPLKKIFFGGLFFCLLAGLVYFAIWSPYLWVEKIEVKGAKSVPVPEIKKIAQEKLSEKLWRLIPQKSIVLAPINQIKENILNQFSEIREVDVYREVPNFLGIKIEERESIGIWCQVEYQEIEKAATSTEIVEEEVLSHQEIKPERKINQCFYIDKEGIIFKDSPLIRGSLIVNIYSARASARLRDKVISPEIINFILTVRKSLPEIKTAFGSLSEAVDFEVISFEDLRVATSLGWQIYFNPAYSVDSQLSTLAIVLEKEIKQAVDSLEYVDLRIEGRVYYK
jgi:hypothetical protein